MTCRLLFTLGLLQFFVAVSGCSNNEPRGERVSTVSAAGIVTFEGLPLDSHMVTFIPVQGDRGAAGVTDSAGKFVLGTNKPADGAAPGRYKVTVSFYAGDNLDGGNPTGIEDPSKMPKPKVKIPVKYSIPDRSGIEIEIPASGNDNLVIELKK